MKINARKLSLFLIPFVIGVGSAYWILWPYVLFQEPGLFYLIEKNAESISGFPQGATCDVDQTKQLLGRIIEANDPEIYEYFRTSVRIVRATTGNGCLIEVPSGLDSFSYKIKEACWLTGIRFDLPLKECQS
jgi:hypothetical protein